MMNTNHTLAWHNRWNRTARSGTDYVVELVNAAANMQEEHSAWGADRSSKEAHVHLSHHVVELNVCGCKSQITNPTSGEQTE